MQTPQYVPQPHVALWLSSNERFQVPKNPSVFLQQMRDGTFIWRLLTIHMTDPPSASDSITERWRQIAAALLDCGTELTPHGLKLILLGDADVLDKVLNVLFSLHHAGGQGTSVVASLMTPCVPEPEVLYPRLFHSALVNAKQSNFVERVKSLTDGCCTADTKDIDRELLQLEALSSHSKRLVEYGLSEEFFRLALRLMNRQRATPMGLRVAALVKTFVYEVGPDASYSSLTGKPSVRAQVAPSAAAGGRSSSRAPVHDDEDDEPAASVEMLSNISELLRSADALPELQDFVRLLVTNIAAPSDNASSATTSGEGKLVYLLRKLFPCSVVGHAALIEQLWLLVLRVADRSVVTALTPWITGVAVALLEGRDPDHETYGRFNPNGRFEEGFCEDRGLGGMSTTSAGDATSEVASSMPSARGAGHRPSVAMKGPSTAASRGDEDDDEGEDAVRVAKRTADLRLKLRKQQAHERHEREVCLAALRLCLRLWSECPQIAQSSDLVFDVMEFLKTSRGLELSRRPELLCEIACAMFVHPMFYAHAIVCLETVQRTPELRRMLLQNLCDYHGRPYAPTATAGAMEDGGNASADATASNVAHVAAAARSDGSLTSRRSTSPNSAAVHASTQAPSRAVQIVDLIGTVTELYPSIAALGHVEASLLVVIANCLVAEFSAIGPTVVSPQPTAGGLSTQNGGGGGPAIGTGAPRGAASAANLFGASMTSSVDVGHYGGAGAGDGAIAMHTVAQFIDVLVALFDQDPFFQSSCVQAWMILSSYFFSLPAMEPLRAEYIALCTTSINELLTLSERHPATDLVLQAIAQLFIDHSNEGRRTIAECVHMYFQIVVRREPAASGPQQQHPPAAQQGKDAGATEVFTKKLKKLCELVGMPTTRVKVKVLDEEEAAKQAILRRAEEEERKRVALEEAERMRQEAEEREEKLAQEGGHERRKKYVRQPLYVAPEPPKPGELGRGSIFEYKRNLHWVKTNLVLGLIMDKVGVGISRRDYDKHVATEASVRRGDQTTRPVPESFWSGWQKGKKYEELQKERRQEEEAEMQRREILRRIRDQEVKEKLKEEAYLIDVKKLNQLLVDEQQHMLEEESDGRTTIRNAYLKVLVALYHMFRDENGHLVANSESAHRNRDEALKKQHEEERAKAREKVAKYWEEKEFLESQLLVHRQQAEEEEAKRQEARKRQYLDEQKRKLMSWRLQNQYEAGGGDSALLSTGISSTSTTMSDGPGHPRGAHGSNAKPKKKSIDASALQATSSSPNVERHASVPRLNAKAAAGAKLAPIDKKKVRKDSLSSVDEAQRGEGGTGGGGSVDREIPLEVNASAAQPDASDVQEPPTALPEGTAVEEEGAEGVMQQ